MDDKETLVYTQHSVAFPRVPLERSIRDEVGVSLDYEGGGTGGEFDWSFYTFDQGHRGVRLQCFGDGLKCLYDPRVQKVMDAWRKTFLDPDSMGPEDLISLLEAAGAVASKYHQRGVRESARSSS